MPESTPKTPREPREVEEVDDSSEVDEASEESFPASDPPSWAMGKQAEPQPSPAREQGGEEWSRNRGPDRHGKGGQDGAKQAGRTKR